MTILEQFQPLLDKLPGDALVCGGSTAGKLYSNYPWPPLDVLPAHRHNTQEKVDFLCDAAGGFKGKVVSDIGCANGAVTLGIWMKGGISRGYDWNSTDIELARLANSILGCGSEFFTQDITSAIPAPLKVAHVIVYLSVWKWVVRNRGVEAANGTLRNVSEQTDMLLFESGITDSGIDLVPYKRKDIPDILEQNTRYKNIELVGQLPKDHQNVNRDLWRCW